MTQPTRLLIALLVLAGAPALAAPPAPSAPKPAAAKPKKAAPPAEAKPAPPAEKKPAPQEDSRPVRGTRVTLVPPEGFVESPRFSGFQNDATGASIMVTELPAAFEAVTAAFESEPMAKKGMKLLDKEAVSPGGAKGLLVHLEQEAAGTTYRKWMLALGDGTATALVTGTFRAETEAQESEPVKTAVLSARRDLETEAPPLDMPFTLRKTPGLARAHQVQNVLLYTSDGKLQGHAPEDPLLLVAQSLGNPGTLHARDFSEKRVRMTAGVKDVTVESGAPLEVDGLKGYELVARAKDAKTDAALVLHQVLLLEEDGYFLLQGRMGEARRDEYLPRFQEAARSLQRTR